ncbi:MAG: hypothetical protein JWN50_261 [Parcubacteria group bacterium]|nr:hypothetical protein [Parcubacteria group bacterium]
MPRNVEDIIPSSKRSIRDVPIPEDRRHRSRRAEDREPVHEGKNGIEIPIHKEHVEEEVREPVRETVLPRMKASMYREPKKGNGSSRKGIWIAAAVGLIVVVFAVFSFMRSATLAYTPKSAPLTFSNDILTAYKTGGDGILLFSVVKISDQKGLAVQASGETQVSRKASGSIIVYNNASAAPQTLVKTTRFQTTDGKIYRVGQDISIPGKTSAGPGSLEITVTADQPGESYNIGLTDFTLPGLKGDARFSTIYARSKTPMTGGLVGTEKGVTPEALAAGKTSLEASLKTELIEEAQAQVPADFVLFPSLSTIAYADLPQSSSTGSTVNINEKGDFFGVIFKRSDLDEYIKDKKLSLPASQTIAIPNLEDLAFSFSGSAPDNLLTATQISFQVSGTTTAVWVVDEAALKKDLSGQSKNDLGSILKNYPGVASADAIIRPFWKTSFPSLPSDITIKKNPVK